MFVLLPDADTVFSASGMHRSTSYFSKYYALPTQNAEDVLQELNCTENTVRCDENITTHRGTAETLSFIYPLPKNADGIGGTAVFCVQTRNLTPISSRDPKTFRRRPLSLTRMGNTCFLTVARTHLQPKSRRIIKMARSAEDYISLMRLVSNMLRFGELQNSTAGST